MYDQRVSLFIVQSQWCNYRVRGIPVNYVADVWPSEQWPNGREAFHLAQAWYSIEELPYSGMLLVGCDVAADPDDLEAMTSAVTQLPRDVHTGMVKLWPASTGREDWMWSHRPGSVGNPAATQEDTAPVSYFSLGFLWAPARLLNLACPAMESWRWGEVDVRLSELALTNGIAAHTVPGCRPKHLHFQEEHDGNAIRKRATNTP